MNFLSLEWKHSPCHRSSSGLHLSGGHIKSGYRGGHNYNNRESTFKVEHSGPLLIASVLKITHNRQNLQGSRFYITFFYNYYRCLKTVKTPHPTTHYRHFFRQALTFLHFLNTRKVQTLVEK